MRKHRLKDAKAVIEKEDPSRNPKCNTLCLQSTDLKVVDQSFPLYPVFQVEQSKLAETRRWKLGALPGSPLSCHHPQQHIPDGDLERAVSSKQPGDTWNNGGVQHGWIYPRG